MIKLSKLNASNAWMKIDCYELSKPVEQLDDNYNSHYDHFKC